MNKLNTAALLALAGLLSMGGSHAGDAEPPKERGRDCLFASQPSSWRVLDKQTLILWGPSQRDAYLVKLFSPVPDMKFSVTLAVIDGDRNGMICGGSTDKITVPDAISSFPANIDSMRKVDDAELLALGEQYKMKLISDKRAEEVKKHDKHIHE